MKNILLIEDNESILKGLVYSLEQERFKVTTAMTIKDSKNLLESNNIYNLIILKLDNNFFSYLLSLSILLFVMF